MIWIEFAVLIGMILIGAQMKGIGLGVMGMVGLFIFLFVFKMKIYVEFLLNCDNFCHNYSLSYFWQLGYIRNS